MKSFLFLGIFYQYFFSTLQQRHPVDNYGKKRDYQWDLDRRYPSEDQPIQVEPLGEDDKLPIEASGSATFFSHGETRDFLQFLKRINYDHRQVPENRRGEAVMVEVSVVVSNIRSVSEVTMDYALELFYRESWTDNRLRYDKRLFNNKTELFLHESYTNFLWFPDTFVPNAIASKNPQRHSISHRSLLRLSEKGTILYSRRISLICECTMDLTLFPFDRQLCKLGIESYGYTADQVIYKWSNGTREAIRLAKIRLPDFTINSVYVTRHMEEYATGNYSRLYACFVFTRSSGFCFLQLIIPSTAIVITAWVALWIETEMEFQDMISIILAITFLIFSYNELMPRVSYIKAMDFYLGVCFMICFLSLIKLALMKYMRQAIAVNSFPSSHHNAIPPLPDLSQISTRRRNKILRQSGLRAISTTSPTKYKYPPTLLDDDIPIEKSKKWLISQKISGLFEFQITPAAVHRFHWISQMLFLFGFVTFCLFYFLVYPNLQVENLDPACDPRKAEHVAPID